MSRTIDADELLDGYKNMGYDPAEHPEESYMEGWRKGFNAAVDHCMHHVIHAPTIEPERRGKLIHDKIESPLSVTGYFYSVSGTCPECGTQVMCYANYCPYCSARMEEGGE